MSSDECVSGSDEDDYEDTADFTGNVFANKYVMIKRIGTGASSSAWLAYNFKKSTFVVIKVQFENDTGTAKDEIFILKRLRKLKTAHISYLIDNFQHKNRICMVFSVLGENLLHYCDNFKLSTTDIKLITKQILEGLDALHKIGVIHTDIKPENILFGEPAFEVKLLMTYFKKNLPVDLHTSEFWLKYTLDTLKNLPNAKAPKEDEVDFCFKITDFGTSCLMEDDIKETTLGTRYYLPPEIILACEYDTKIDIFAVGCILYELVVGDVLFDPKKTSKFTTDQNHIQLIQDVLGTLPKRLNQGKKYKDVFNTRQIMFDKKCDATLHKLIKDDDDLLDLLQNLLHVNSNNRITAHEALRHKWLSVTEDICYYVYGNTIQNSYGIYCPSDEKRNISTKIKDVKTKEELELLASIYILETYPVNNVVYTDGDFLYKCANEFIPVWKANKWKTSKKKPVKHKELYQTFDTLLLTRNIKFKQTDSVSKRILHNAEVLSKKS